MATERTVRARRDRAKQLLSGIFLAGGAARRLGGRDKASLPIPGGRRPRSAPPGRNRSPGPTTAELALSLLGQLAAETLVAGGRPELFRPLTAAFPHRLIEDHFRGMGPLAGLEAGLRASSYPFALVVPCDMPFLQLDILGYLVDLALDTAADAVVPLWEGRSQPLVAVYRETCAETAELCLEGDQRDMASFLSRLRLLQVSAEDLRRFPGAAQCFENWNEPEQWGLDGE